MTDEAILVLGATGGQGGAVVDALLARGGTGVRAVVRDPGRESAQRLARRGVAVVTGALEDRESLVSAMRDVAAVFAVTTPFEAGLDAEVEQGRTIIAAAHQARVPHLVFSSVAGADQDSGVPHFQSKAMIERDLVEGDVSYTILGPTYFFDNALGGEQRIRAGVLELPLPSGRPLQQLARADLGRFAAEVLRSPSAFAGQRIELAGDAPTPARMAAALTATLARPVRHEQSALSSIVNPDMRAMWQFLTGPGYQVDIDALRAAHPGMLWTSFADWANHVFGASA